MLDYISQNLPILKQYGVRKILEAGRIIQHQDEPVGNIYIVIDGKAMAHVFEANGKEICLDTYLSGDLIGLEYFRNTNPSQSQVSAMTKLTVLQFKKHVFFELSQDHIEISQYVLEQFSSRLQKFQDSHIETQILTKRGRVASEIRRLATRDLNSDHSYIVTPKPVISDMAARLGIARETVSRTVNNLIKDAVIERNRTALYVPDLTLLEAEMR